VVATLTGPVSVWRRRSWIAVTFLKNYAPARGRPPRVGPGSQRCWPNTRARWSRPAPPSLPWAIRRPPVEILGPQLFQEYAVHYLNDLIGAIHALATPGDRAHLRKTGQRHPPFAGIGQPTPSSVDAMVSLKGLKADSPPCHHGQSEHVPLAVGAPDKIAERAVELVRDGVDIIAPDLRASTRTTLASITAMTRAVKDRAVVSASVEVRFLPGPFIAEVEPGSTRFWRRPARARAPLEAPLRRLLVSAANVWCGLSLRR